MALRRTLIMCSLACTGYVAASLVGTQNATATLRTSADNAAAESAQPIPPLQIQRNLTMQRGETLAGALKKAGFNPIEIATLTASTPSVTKPVSSKTELSLTYTESAPYQIQQASLTYRPTPIQEVTLNLNNGQAKAQVVAKPMKDTTGVAVGTIHDSLYQDATEAGLTPAQVNQFMNIFAWDLDYTRDIHPGDTFKVTYEQTVNDKGVKIKTGRILAAEFKVDGEVRSAYWYGGEYLNEKGESKKKLLLRTPLEFTRISSSFATARMHPLLGFTRAHKGTDFAAAMGTPVKASGNGVVTYEGWHGGHGNYLMVKHNDTFTTAYAHLSKYASNIKVGSKVTQGQVIGYVGMTGLATGPHLHYEVIKNGEFVDAMRTDLPTGSPLGKTQLAQFRNEVSSAQTAWNAAFQSTNRQVASR